MRKAILGSLAGVLMLARTAGAQDLGEDLYGARFLPLRHFDLYGATNAGGSVTLGMHVTVLNFAVIQMLGLGVAGRVSVGNPSPNSRLGFQVTSRIVNFPIKSFNDSNLLSIGSNVTYDVGARKHWGISVGLSLSGLLFN